MPTYDYICSLCGDRFEHFQSMTSDVLLKKPNCGDGSCNVQRIVSGGTGLIFKGTGFYLTDYKNKSKPDNSKTEKKSSTKKAPKKNVRENAK